MRRGQIVAPLALLSCASPSARPASSVPNPQADSAARAADHAELLRLHERARTAHLERRADWLVADWADSLVSISRGGVSVGSAERGRAGFQKYLDASTFQAWDDIVPPRIRISPNGQMAYVVVQKRVHVTTQGPRGRPQAERTRFAWLSVYEKQGSEWRLSVIASTERPDSL